MREYASVHSLISALFLFFLQVHPNVKSSFFRNFFLLVNLGTLHVVYLKFSEHHGEDGGGNYMQHRLLHVVKFLWSQYFVGQIFGGRGRIIFVGKSSPS